MISESAPVPVFTKKCLGLPSWVVESLNVDANPDPPCEAIVVLLSSSPRASKIAGSTLIPIVAVTGSG